MHGANSETNWNNIWADPEQAKWREQALRNTYNRICQIIPRGWSILDVGGGVGTFARTAQALGATVEMVDGSREAVRIARESGVIAHHLRVGEGAWQDGLERRGHYAESKSVMVMTEFFEHLTHKTQNDLMEVGQQWESVLISIPNDRLGPEDEAQHTIRWTALQFLNYLRRWYGARCRVECVDGYLLGVCGALAHKSFKLAVCFPARNEESDVERVLASFRGVADVMVVGIDPRSTDRTRKIAERYAEQVFTLDSPEGPKDDELSTEGAVHFSHIRNQCMQRCEVEGADWTFMTEAHEHLKAGVNSLLNLQAVPDHVRYVFVARQGWRNQWAFPWLCRSDMRYKRRTHNQLDIPDGTPWTALPKVVTWHERAQEVAERRHEQRKACNRKSLQEDWMRTGNRESLLYLAGEWRGYDDNRAVERMREYLSLPSHHGPQRYHVRLMLAKQLAVMANDAKHEEQAKLHDEVRAVLVRGAEDDWSRTEHYVWLGDLAWECGARDEALQWYLHGAARIEDPPFTMWWIDLDFYSYIPAQRLAMAYAEAGEMQKALQWAREVRRLLPDGAPDGMLEEAERNVTLIEESFGPCKP